jgi:hypothetical protein
VLARHRALAAVALVALALVALAAPIALAVSPKRNASYIGVLSEAAGRLKKRVVLKVAKDGSARARLECANTRSGLTAKFAIVKGKFTGKQTVGSTLVWRLQGTFVSKTKARAQLFLHSVCDGKGGKITLTLAG